MIFIKQILSNIILYDESLNLIKEFRDSTFIIKENRVKICKNDTVICDMPYDCVAILL